MAKTCVIYTRFPFDTSARAGSIARAERKPAMPDTLSTIAAPETLELGSLRVTALHDGHFDLPVEFLQGTGAPTQAPGPTPGATFRLDVNAFLLRGGARTILVDTGCGSQLGPDVDKLVAGLRAEGVAPENIDAVLCTHIHPDHTNGLIDALGQARFPHAEVFVHETEAAFWLDEVRRANASGDMRQLHDWAHAAFAPYAGRIVPFSAGEVLAGVEAVPLPGHTPGHTGFQFDGGGNRQLLIWGDCVHEIGVQAADPSIGVAADVDIEAARATRASLFDRVAADGVLVAGMHLAFPGFGRLHRDGAAYAYDPAG